MIVEQLQIEQLLFHLICQEQVAQELLAAGQELANIGAFCTSWGRELGKKSSSLLNLLLDLFGLIEFAGLAVGGSNAERLLKEPTGLQAVGTDIALGLDRGFALRRDGHFDDTRYVDFSVRA